MLQIRTIIQGQPKFLDLYQNEPILLSLSFAELQDITKKNSTFSKAFSLPGSKKNNEIFNFFYDINSIPTNFNPNNKFEAQLLWDGYEILQGHIRLNGVTVSNGEIIYQCTFYNQIGDLMANVGDKYLFNLDLNYLDHPYTDDVILYSNLDPNLFPLTGSTNYSYQNGKTMWGLYNIGYNYTNSTSGYTQYFNASSNTTITIGAGLKTFTTQSGLPYQVGDEIKLYHDSTRFMYAEVVSYNYSTGSMQVNVIQTEGSGSHNPWTISLVYPASGSIVDLEQTPLIQFTPYNPNTGTYNPIPPNFDFSGTPVHDYYFKPTIQIRELYEAILREAGYQLRSDFMDTAYFKRYYMPLKFVDETIYSRNALPACYTFNNSDLPIITLTTTYLNPSSGLTCNSLGFSANTNTFVIPGEYSANYNIRFTFKATPSLNDCSTGFPSYQLYFSDGITNTMINANNICDGKTTQVSFTQEFIISGTSYLQFYFQGDLITITDLQFEIINPPRFIPLGSTINYGIEFPDNDYKQIDFLTSVNKFFNLLVVPDPDDPKKLIVEPIVDYVGSGQVLDWTNKIDYNSVQNIYPTSTLVNGTLKYDLKLDQDYANQDFKTQTNRVFGTDQFKLNLEYKDETTNFTYIFSSPIDITINNAYVPLITASSMSKVKTVDKEGQSLQTFVPFKILPKMVFRGLTIPQDNYGFIGGTGSTTGNSFCASGITINTTDDGYIKFQDCFGNTTYEYVGFGTTTFNDCLNPSTFLPGFPYSNLATFTITSSGTACGGNIVNVDYQSWWMDDVQVDRWTNMNRFTTYPWAYTGFSHYINFRGEDKTDITPSEFSFISQDIYNIYYEDYVDDITSEENKIFAAKIYLYPQDIQSLRWDEKILINNTYFRINKISNFNALEPAICDIELVKLTKQYTSHPILYYDLIPCSSGSTLHSHSDLMYHLYAYAGNYVKLYDDSLNYLGCYNVQVGSYNSGYTYEHYWLSSGYTPNLVGVYPDCNCSGRTQLTIVQEEPGIPRYFYYSGLSCSDSATTYTFKSTLSSLSGGSASYKIQNSATTITECIFNAGQTYQSITPWIEISAFTSCIDCNYVPPTPTPTITPTNNPTPTMTPTISVTPSITPTNIGGELFVYSKYKNNEQILQYQINGGSFVEIGNIDSLTCQYFYTITGLTIGDSIDFTTLSTCVLALSTSTCPNTGFSCSQNYVFPGGTNFVYITVDGSNCC